ncbi:mechanosensitive ion channel family protein [Leptolyngbya sp. CCNP1308]|uniref:mechanosensitive ion channel family protein n=1 Tax=Leptolyngbya sp. CCNP1308 TaxID=3110255 RepID=UPI002B218037|nr:mechanosensitive ion channel family protein [Leptolyngbya sp. CCNP1308]MEA5451209.1 mechanosensitive ion channel family protein [Leptolyngbya sp. CCNP1308]
MSWSDLDPKLLRRFNQREVSIFQRIWRSRAGGILLVVILLLPGAGLQAQEEEASPAEPAPAPALPGPAPAAPEPTEDAVFFADVLVRGQPVFQIGSLPGLSASDRAAIINRRIGGLLSQAQELGAVTVQVDEDRQIALLTVNNRVLMTVTQQDATDFGLTVEELAQQWADQLNQVLAQPNLAIDVLQRLDGTARQLVDDTIVLLPSLMGAIVLVGLTWIVALGVRRVGLLWAEQTEGDRSTEILIGRLCYGGVWVIGSIVALGVLGLNFTTLLGTLGLTSVAIGFSLKDVLSNYISGVILLAARPFRISDQVVIGSYEGTVVQIQLRATTMRTYDGRLVYIPNQKVFQSSIVNNTESPVRRSDVIVGIDYEDNITAARQVITEAVTQVEGVEKDPPPLILVHELAASTVNLEVLFWVNSRRQSFLQVTSAASQAIKEALQAAGIDMPTEIYTLTFRDRKIADLAIANAEAIAEPSETRPE